MWEKDTSGECSDKYMDTITITDGYNLNMIGLEEDSSYKITVIETNIAGNAVSDPVIGTTKEAGEELNGNL